MQLTRLRNVAEIGLHKGPNSDDDQFGLLLGPNFDDDRMVFTQVPCKHPDRQHVN